MIRVLWLAATLALLGSGSYVFVYLYRWQWNRALLMVAFFIAIEVAVAATVMVRGLRRLERQVHAERRQVPDAAVVARLREAAPRRDHFAWLGVRGDRTSVFITMVVGGGIVVSGLAWAIDRVASRTAGRHLEDRLAGDLAGIAFPEGLVPDETELLAEEAPYEHDRDLGLLLGTPERS